MNDSKPNDELVAARSAYKKRATEITQKCAFTDTPISDRAKEACKTIEMLFEEVTQEIALLLPGEFRTALCLEHLENACLWAKKAIQVHDHYLTTKETNVTDNNKN